MRFCSTFRPVLLRCGDGKNQMCRALCPPMKSHLTASRLNNDYQWKVQIFLLGSHYLLGDRKQIFLPDHAVAIWIEILANRRGRFDPGWHESEMLATPASRLHIPKFFVHESRILGDEAPQPLICSLLHPSFRLTHKIDCHKLDRS